jgi:hypothetical protein
MKTPKKRNKNLSIHIEAGANTFTAYLWESNQRARLNDLGSSRYSVDHVFEIVLPIWEKYIDTHNIEIFINGQRYGLIDLEQSYYDYMEENENA